MRDTRLVLSSMDFSSLTPTRRTILSGALFCCERGPHPRAGFNRRRRDAATVMQQQPQSRIQVAPLPVPGNLHQTAQAQSVGLFFTLFAIEHRTRMRGYCMYRASIFGGQEPAGAIRSSGRDERANADQPAPGENNRARAGKKIVEGEPPQIGLVQVLGNPMEVCRN